MDIDAKYQSIKRIATANGANRDMIYHWKFRRKMPRDWQVVVFKASSGAVTFDEMEAVFSKDRDES